MVDYLIVASLITFGAIGCFVVGRYVLPWTRTEILVLRKQVNDLHAKVDELIAELKNKLPL